MQTLFAWVRNFLFLVLTLSFLEMLLPSAGTRQFVKWLMGLVVLTFVLRSISGVAYVDLSDWEKWLSQTNYSSVESIVAMGQRIAEGGEGPVLEAIQQDYNHNLKSMILVMEGVKDAEVITQLGPKGEIQRIIATIATTRSEEQARRAAGKQETDVQPVEQVQVMPIAVGLDVPSSARPNPEKPMQEETSDQSFSLQLAAKVRRFIAAYYRVPESTVRVVLH